MKCFRSCLSLYSVAFSVSVSLCFMPYVLYCCRQTSSTLCFLLTLNLFCFTMASFFSFQGKSVDGMECWVDPVAKQEEDRDSEITEHVNVT